MQLIGLLISLILYTQLPSGGVTTHGAGGGGGTTFNAAGCSAVQIQVAITAEQVSPHDGDIINIPSGTCSWSGSDQVAQTFNNSVTIQGQGAVSSTTSGASTTGSDVTVINNGSNGSPGTWTIATVAGKSLRITGIAFLATTGSNTMLYIGGSSTAVRIDHCHLFTQNVGIYLIGSVLGVADHVFFDAPSNSVINSLAFHNGSNWNGSSDGVGQASWADTDHWGTSQFFFVEDSRFTGDIGDGHDGARYVLRHDTMVNSFTNQHGDQMYNHGLTPDPARGFRAAEVYLNNAVAPTGTGNPLFSVNSGTLLFWSNTATQYRGAVQVDNTRKADNPPNYVYVDPPNGWGHCNPATSTFTAWDTPSTGYPCLDQPGRGKGDLLSGSTFPGMVNSRTGTIAQVNQVLTPVYSWLITYSSSYGDSIITDSSGYLANNLDYYMQFGGGGNVGSFNGTAGVNSSSSAPSGTCTAGPGGNTPGVGWWDTTNNTLYVCNPTNTWTAYYTPYTYPHPLASP